MTRKRNNRKPNLTEQVASLILTLRRPDGNGGWEPIVSFEQAKGMTAAAICKLVQWDHVIYDAWGGTNHPTNIVALPVAVHREKTALVDIPTIAKSKRIAKAWSEHKQVMDAKAGLAELPLIKKKAARKRIVDGSKASPFKKKVNRKVERRAEIRAAE